MPSYTPHRRAHATELVNRRLAVGLLLSMLLHALVLSLQFGIPAWKGGKSDRLEVTLAPLPAVPDAPAPAPAAPSPAPSVDEGARTQDAAAPSSETPVAPAGMRVVDPVEPPRPVAVRPPRRKRGSAHRRVRPQPQPEALAQMDTPVIVQEQKTDDKFALPLPRQQADPGPASGNAVVPEAREQRAADAAGEPAAAKVVEQAAADDKAVAQQLAAEQAQLAAEEARAQARRQADEQQARELALQREQAEREQQAASEAQARVQAEQEAARKAMLRQQEEEARQLAQQREAAEANARLKAEEMARQQADQQAKALARQQAEQLARQQAEALARQQAEQLARQQAEALARQQAEALARQQAEQLARQQAEQLARQQAEALARQQAEALARHQAEALARQQAEALARQQAEQLARQHAEQLARQQAESLARQQAEALARQQAGRDPSAQGDALQPGSGAAGRNGSLPRSALGGDVASRALELARGLDLLHGEPPVRPREDPQRGRRVVSGPSEHDVALRLYVDSFRQKIERNGTLNQGQLPAGRVRIDPLVSVALRSDGSVEDVIILRSSGHPDTDEAVRRIVRLNARYSAFPPNVAARYDVVEIRRIWTFADGLKLMEEVP